MPTKPTDQILITVAPTGAETSKADCPQLPTTLEELLGVPGLGKRRALRYQDELLAVGRELSRKVGG